MASNARPAPPRKPRAARGAGKPARAPRPASAPAASRSGTPDDRRNRSHDAIVDAAARLFREKGFAGVGVDELMGAAGLTHGGFYSHFADKTALMVEALDRAFVEAQRNLLVGSELRGEAWFDAARARYVNAAHVDAPGGGCVVPALGAEVSRAAPAVKTAFTAGLLGTLAALEGKLRVSPDHDDDDPAGAEAASPAAVRARLLASLAQWVGAITLARAVDDPAFVDEILVACGGPARKKPTPRPEPKP